MMTSVNTMYSETRNKKGLEKSERDLIRKWRSNPAFFFTTVLGWEPWDKQRVILQSLLENKETYVQSCNSAGKSWLAAGIVIWWLATRNGKVITTAPTWRQVKSILWSKIAVQCQRAPILGMKPLQSRLDVGPDWYAEGLSTRQPERFQGYHGKVLVVVDEASGIENEEIWGSIDGNLTDFKEDRLLAIGNPNDPESPFARKCKLPNRKGSKKTIKISAFDTPNVKQGKKVVDGLVTAEFVREKTIEWGVNSPMYQIRILGEFPKTGGMSMFPLAWLERAFNYETEDIWIDTAHGVEMVPGYPDLSSGEGVMGFDVAAGGADNNALCYRDGGKVLDLQGWQEIDTSELVVAENNPAAPSLYSWVDKYMPGVVQIDAVGPGQIIYKYAQKHKNSDPRYKDLRFRPFIAQAKPIRENFYANKKAEAYWQFRLRLQENRVDLSSLPNDRREAVEKQAAVITWRPDGNGKVQIDSKEKLRSKHGFSPDELEAMIMAFYGSDQFKVDREAVAAYTYEKNAWDDDNELVAAFDYNYEMYRS